MYRKSVITCDVCNRDISYINFSKHCKTGKHLKNVYESEKVSQHREQKKVELALNNEKICSIVLKLTVDDMKFILKHHNLVESSLKLEVQYHQHK